MHNNVNLFFVTRGAEGQPEACHRAVQQGHPPGQHRAGDGAPVRAQRGRHRPDHSQQQVRHRLEPAGHAHDVKNTTTTDFFFNEDLDVMLRYYVKL